MTNSTIEPENAFKGKTALILGVANERSLAWGIAQSLSKRGVKCGFNYLGESLERRVRPLAESLNSDLIAPCNVSEDDQLDALFTSVAQKWGRLDYLIHSVAFAPKDELEGRFLNTSRAGFQTALDISAFSLIATAKRAAPLMKEGGSIVTLTYHGSQVVVPYYKVMGVAKAALEATVRYLAHDLGPDKIRVNAISAGPVKTLAASGIKGFRSLLSEAEQKTPLRENITGEDVGELATFLCSSAGRHITGSLYYLDSGAHIMGQSAEVTS